MKKVLIVDDSQSILALLSAELKKYENIEAFYAKNYKDAMKLIRSHQGNFHAAILDLKLPDALNGEIVKLANSHHIPSVIFTATADESLKDHMRKREIIDFIMKDSPSSIKFAVSAINRTLRNYNSCVLVVDDSELSRTTIINSLKKINLNWIEAEDGQEALEIMQKRDDISLVLTDYEMPNINGLDLTFKLREKYQKDELGIIAISSADEQDVISQFLKFGANDYIHKPSNHNEIVTRVNANLELLDLFSHIKEMANKDFLTGLYNRRYFFESGNAIYKNAKRQNKNLTIAMLDIDFFKKINDTYGHEVGDTAIKEVKKILTLLLRESDLIARFGGEEFCVLLHDISLDDAKKLFEKIRLYFENNIIQINEIKLSYTMSIGVYHGLSDSLESLINLSDESLYEAKETGRNKVIIKS